MAQARKFYAKFDYVCRNCGGQIKGYIPNNIPAEQAEEIYLNGPGNVVHVECPTK